MEEQASQASPRKNLESRAGRSLDRQRRRVEELLAAQRARLENVETNLDAQFKAISEAIVEAEPSADSAGEELREQSQALSRQAEELSRAKLELAETERRLVTAEREAADQKHRAQEQLRGQKAEIEAAEDRLRQAERDLKLAREEQAVEAEQIAGRQARCADLEKRLAYEQDQLELLREQTKTQRRRIAQELKAERASQQRELDRLRHDVELLQAGQRQSLDQASRQLQRERAELEEKLNREREEVRRHEVELEAKVAQEREELQRQKADLEQKLGQEREELRRLQDELDAKLAQHREEIRRQASEREVQETAIEATQRQLEARERQFAQQRSDDVERLHGEMDVLTRALATAEESAAKTAGELAALRQSREALQKDYDILWHADEELQQTNDELRQTQAALEHSHTALQQSLGELREQHNRLQQAYDELLHTHEQLSVARERADRELSERSTAGASNQSELKELRAEREALVARLAAAETKLADEDLQRQDELQRRFEMAVDDARSLKRRNSELEEEIIGLKSAGPRTVVAPSGEGSNWETMKRQMLESLEADADKSPERAEERATIESTIHITDDVVARKDHEIAELKLLLSQQSSNIGSVAVGASAIAGAFDQDELIQQERRKLAELQEEWTSKLRQAEIDISVERAKITRDRAQIEEKLANYEVERARQGSEGDSTAGGANDSGKKPTRGRWLARLGLKDGD